jgi:hypothetical protein
VDVPVGTEGTPGRTGSAGLRIGFPSSTPDPRRHRRDDHHPLIDRDGRGTTPVFTKSCGDFVSVLAIYGVRTLSLVASV